jgi:hypothetical protein
VHSNTESAALPVLADAYLHEDVRETPVEARDIKAQCTLTELRRAARPDSRTWSPFDQNEPDPMPTAVRDGDADVWRRNSRSGRWRMAGFRAAEHEAAAGKALAWQELALKYGPLTEDGDGEDE